MTVSIHVTILDDHLAIIDGYISRLKSDPEIEVVNTVMYGEELEASLAGHPSDVLLLDVQVPTSRENSNPYPILHCIPKLLEQYPDMSILVISMFTQRTLINSVMEAGASGYVLKDDAASIRELASIVRTIASGGIHMSQLAYQQLRRLPTGELPPTLSTRQLEALSLAAAYPDSSTADMAERMNIAPSTVRNLLSGAYLKLEVRTRAAAIAKARQLGLITPPPPEPPFEE